MKAWSIVKCPKCGRFQIVRMPQKNKTCVYCGNRWKINRETIYAVYRDLETARKRLAEIRTRGRFSK
ncbi:MAG: hypothetical protein DRJ45_01525 [Thermoprotei archaeon]|nr:MAG: hypothetical protein DRJ45_01525 [Thermoprotei archaeon]